MTGRHPQFAVRCAVLIGLALPAAVGGAAPALAVPATIAATTGTPAERAVVAGIERRAHPLRTTEPGGPTGDLVALSRIAKGATVVGLGEATHGSKTLFRLKERVFRHLVQRDGFRTFSLEASWSAGTRIDAYVTRGEGDLRQIMREEFQFSFEDWNNEEFLALFTWMREHNRTAAPGEQVRVMGNDIGDVHRSQYDRVMRWAEEHRPALAPEVRQRYAGLLALPASTGERMKHLSTAPLAERRTYDEDARAAYRALERAGGVDPWVLQEARGIARMATLFAYDFADPAQVAEHNRHRDRAMAENTVWWQRQTGDRILVSAHNAHLGYESADPAAYPMMQGEVFRELIGDRYLAIGTTIHSGEYRALDRRTNTYGVFDTGPAAPGSNEHTLDKVRLRDYFVDLREVTRDPAAGPWLRGARPTFVVPGSYPNETQDVSLARSFDVIVHLHRVSASVPVT